MNSLSAELHKLVVQSSLPGKRVRVHRKIHTSEVTRTQDAATGRSAEGVWLGVTHFKREDPVGRVFDSQPAAKLLSRQQLGLRQQRRVRAFSS